jgi:heme exporter protein B
LGLPIAVTRRRVGWATQAWLIFRKDLAIELATGELVATSGLLAVLLVVVGSLASHAGPQASIEVAPGVFWVAVAFASVLALGRSWQREREHDALSGLLTMPISRSAIFAGKTLGMMCFVVAIELLVALATALFFDLSLRDHGPGLGLLGLFAAPGIAAAGTLFGAMTVRTSARDLVLACVLLALLAPALLAAVAGTRALFGGAGLATLGDQLALLGLFAVLFVAGGVGLFGSLVED